METICATGMGGCPYHHGVGSHCRGRTDVALKRKVRLFLFLTDCAAGCCNTPGKNHLRRDLSHWRRKTVVPYQIQRGARCRAGAADKVFPHNLRHLFARTFYRACQDVVKLADILGHSSIETTRIYLLTTGTEHLRQLERLGLLC